MAAFDKVKSGYPGMDDILDYIRMGDNVVWQVTDIDEFRFFALPFVAQAKRDGRSITYVRFAQHAPILEDLDGVDLVEFDPDEGFEAFTVAIHNEITRIAVCLVHGSDDGQLLPGDLSLSVRIGHGGLLSHTAWAALL